MKKIMFVCHGNICRSPMAEFIMKDIVKKAGKENEYLIRSAATSREEIGHHIFPPARREMRVRGVWFDEERRAVQITKSAYDNFDYFIVMDDYNYVNLLRIFGTDPQKKIHKLLDFAEGGEIADPWYTDCFDVAFDEISHGCRALFDFLEQNVPRETIV